MRKAYPLIVDCPYFCCRFTAAASLIIFMGKKIAVIGGGNLGTAIAEGIVESGFSKASDITVTKRNTATLSSLKEKGVKVTNDNNKAVQSSDVIILAIKPFQTKDVLEGIAKDLDASRHILISVVTGVFIKDMSEIVPKKLPLFRAMPNTAIAIRQSMTCLSCANA